MVGIILLFAIVPAILATISHFDRKMGKAEEARYNDPANVRARIASQMGMSQFLKDTRSI